MAASKLKYQNFDTLLMDYWLHHLWLPGNHQRTEWGVRITEDAQRRFSYYDTPNRCKIVSTDIWHELIHEHLHRNNLN